MREEAQQAESVAEGDDDHVTPAERLSVRIWPRSAGEIAAARDPDHHGLATRRMDVARPDVEVQTVFVRDLFRVGDEVGILRARWPGCDGVADARPWLHRHRLAPSQRTQRRPGVRDSEVGCATTSDRLSADLAAGYLDDLARRCLGRRLGVEWRDADQSRDDEETRA